MKTETTTPARLKFIEDMLREGLAANPLPFAAFETGDNLMSSCHLRGSLDAKPDWLNGIFYNSRYFHFMISPALGRRYYDPATDSRVTVEMLTKGVSGPAFRKYTGTPEKAVARILDWIRETRN